MNGEAARLYTERIKQGNLGAWVSVGVPLTTGSYHRVMIYSRGSDGDYEESFSDQHPSRLRELELEVRVGDIIYQRVTSPASANVLERYGVVLGDRHIDWGSDADWIVDFGPMGDVTRRGLRSPASSYRAQQGRTISPAGNEVVGSASQSAGTSGGSG